MKNKWLLNHDESKVFKVLYITLALGLSVFVSLFWLVAVVFIHLFFEIYKHYYENKKIWPALKYAIYEMIPDFALILFSFVIVIYMEIAFGAAGLSVASRGAIAAGSRSTRFVNVFSRIAVRFPAWQRMIRGALMSADDVVLFFKSFFGKKNPKNKSQKDKSENSDKKPSKVGLLFFIVFLLLILLAPILTDKSTTDIFLLIFEELKIY